MTDSIMGVWQEGKLFFGTVQKTVETIIIFPRLLNLPAEFLFSICNAGFFFFSECFDCMFKKISIKLYTDVKVARRFCKKRIACKTVPKGFGVN